ncbi:hypothetical protein HNQ86_002500 [Oleiagrimonas soli]|uniref:Uncharacterized protein n=1 Tax=Oleiagrimonas soli TaxID=1543381 RepID=A0A841KJB8_9GAMM|nr:hypothetical protein [Oleiagrimonas soli]
MKQFIPFDDAWLDHPEMMPGPLVPYQVGLPCGPADEARVQCTGPMRPSSEKVSPVWMSS